MDQIAHNAHLSQRGINSAVRQGYPRQQAHQAHGGNCLEVYLHICPRKRRHERSTHNQQHPGYRSWDLPLGQKHTHRQVKCPQQQSSAAQCQVQDPRDGSQGPGKRIPSARDPVQEYGGNQQQEAHKYRLFQRSPPPGQQQHQAKRVNGGKQIPQLEGIILLPHQQQSPQIQHHCLEKRRAVPDIVDDRQGRIKEHPHQIHLQGLFQITPQNGLILRRGKGFLQTNTQQKPGNQEKGLYRQIGKHTVGSSHHRICTAVICPRMDGNDHDHHKKLAQIQGVVVFLFHGFTSFSFLDPSYHTIPEKYRFAFASAAAKKEARRPLFVFSRCARS